MDGHVFEKKILKGPILVSVHALSEKSKYPYRTTSRGKGNDLSLPLNVNVTSLESSRIRHESTLSFHPPTEKASNLLSALYYALCRIRRVYGLPPSLPLSLSLSLPS